MPELRLRIETRRIMHLDNNVESHWPLVANALIAWLFAITGPLAILLTVASTAQLSQQDIASWIFGSYAVGGLLSIATSYLYRQPVGMAWTIPGALLVAPALEHLSFPEAAGAYLAAGLMITLLGVTGWVRKLMVCLPMPIVLGMVSGVFLPFGLKIVTGFQDSFWIASAIVGSYLLASAVPALGRVVPPVLAALLAGIVAVAMGGTGIPTDLIPFALAQPQLVVPVFSVQALLELALPLVVTVVGIHNPQGIAVLAAAKYKPPVSALTVACGLGSVLAACVGAVPACVTGPSNAIMCASGRMDQRYRAGMLYGLLMLLFGLAAPMAVALGLALPTAFIGVLGGLAIVRVLQGWMSTAFGSELSFGALTAFLVTLSGVSIVHIGAPFWGLVFGLAASWLMERPALQKAWNSS
ncbi:benzoate/H(+) symporter BenE family transporter [Variovorax sp. RO1]|uniref:benzoate/H(+) symporter BenE family transporter n=1 Tax=Variovorax sp. RO1 TaxID=2066034 RepID=UPI001C5DAA6B|nr:benzoate/H(+) symporter BenE family transporter [Variovorax sp. RO1]